MTTLIFDEALAFEAPWPTDQPQPLQQSLGYGQAMRMLGSEVCRIQACDDLGPVFEALMITRRFLGVAKLSTIFRGPLWLTQDASRCERALRDLRSRYPKHRWTLLAIMPDADRTHSPSLLKAAGFRQVMSGFSTIWQDLSPEPETLRAGLNGKWRNQLKKGEQAGLQIAISIKPKHQLWLLEKEVEQRSERRYQALPLGLVPHFRAAEGDQSVLGITAHLSGQKVAGALMLMHGTSATYHVGWVGEAGRTACAHNVVLWQALLALKDRGVRFLDLGGLNTTQLSGLARFKLGLGGTPVTLPGSFL